GHGHHQGSARLPAAPDQCARRRGAGELRLRGCRGRLAPRPGYAARALPRRARAPEIATRAMVRKVLSEGPGPGQRLRGTPPRLVLIGPPGAGKSTLTPALIERFDLARIATGERLRAEVAAGSDLGRAAQEFLERGVLVPDDMMDRVLRACLDEIPVGKGFLFDGYPRNPHQAEALDALLAETG